MNKKELIKKAIEDSVSAGPILLDPRTGQNVTDAGVKVNADKIPETGVPADDRDTWSQIWDQLTNPPMPTSNPLYNALILGAAGALGGGAIGGVTGSDRKKAIRNAIIGSLIGTALGGSAGYFLS